MLLYENEKAAAVYFIGNEGIAREMLYSEFEALLDGVVPVVDWADREARAVYVEIDRNLQITAAVFFRVAFDRKGAVVPSWRLPLVNLAAHAATGPDLGAGAIKLACASHCPMAFYAAELWDPDMRPGSSHFAQLKKSVKRNRLALHFRPVPDGEGAGLTAMGSDVADMLEQKITQQLRRQYEKSFRDHMAQLLKEQRLRAMTLGADKDRTLDELKREHNRRLEQLRQELDDKQRELSEAEDRNQQLKATIDGQAAKIQGLREYFEHKLEKLQGEESEVIAALKHNHALELDAKIAAATTSLQESLQMRDVELMYRNEQESQLREEIARLRRENQELLNNGGDQLLQKLSQKGVTFVTFQPGAGHITIPPSDMPRYSDDPLRFTADHCGVSLTHYQAWLEHYEVPVCQALGSTGDACGVGVPRIAVPADFHPGESDRCERCLNDESVPSLRSAPI